MISGKLWIAAVLGMILITAVSWTAAAGGVAGRKPDGRPVPHAKIRMDEYQNFLRNWDEKKDPLLYAFISTPAQAQDSIDRQDRFFYSGGRKSKFPIGPQTFGGFKR